MGLFAYKTLRGLLLRKRPSNLPFSCRACIRLAPTGCGRLRNFSLCFLHVCVSMIHRKDGPWGALVSLEILVFEETEEGDRRSSRRASKAWPVFFFLLFILRHLS